jgi:tRNA(Arg) A34 adenosine deaminase TadA
MCLASIYWARLERLVFANSRDQAAAIGFDDAAIYDEVSKPISNRSIPTLHLPLPDAEAVFQEWMAKEDKIPY